MRWFMLIIAGILLTFNACKSAPPRPIFKAATDTGQGDLNPGAPTPVVVSMPQPGAAPLPQNLPTPAPPAVPGMPQPVPMPSPIPVTPLPTPAPTPKPLALANGLYTITALHSKKCWEMTTPDQASVINQWGCNGAGIQVFNIEQIGTTGDYKIIATGSKKALEIKAASKDDGAVLQQADFKGSMEQLFRFESDPIEANAILIRSKLSAKLLEVPDSSLKSATIIKQKSAASIGAKNQKWVLTKLASVETEAAAVRYYFVNECDHDVWVGSQPNPGFPTVAGNFKLAPGEHRHADAGAHWEGRFWGRYECSMVNGKLQCSSGQCAGGENCGDTYGEPPVSLAEIKTKGYAGVDYYDISLVDGANLPMNLRPMPGTAVKDGARDSCKALTCEKDLRTICPAELQKKNSQGKVIGCKSACEAFHTDEYCCLGAYATSACRPSKYAKFFDDTCPDAYSFAEDVKTFTCRDADYEVTFCPK